MPEWTFMETRLMAETAALKDCMRKLVEVEFGRCCVDCASEATCEETPEAECRWQAAWAKAKEMVK